MSNIFITDIVGTGTYAIPSNDAQLAAATAGFDVILGAVANLAYDRVLAWVEDQGGPDGAEGVRTLNCLVEKFTYLTKECPSEAEVDAISAAIEAALEADANITSVGQQQYHLFQAGAYFLWNRDAFGGFLYPNTPTDDVAVGPFASPTGKWFDDGDLVLGASTMAGAERLRISGAVRVEKSSADAEPGLSVQVSGIHPVAQQCLFLNVDVDSIGLDIDSEATGNPLINLQSLNTNTRGDIAFGVVRTANPSGPTEGDLWYQSTANRFRYSDGTYNLTMWPQPYTVVTVSPQGGDYTSIKSAIDGITDASGSKPYLVWVFPGIYTEDPITLKQYVAVAGSELGPILVQPSNNSSPLFTFAQNTSIKNLSFYGPTSSSACYAAGAATNVSICKCNFFSGQTAVLSTGSGTRIIVEECKTFPGVTNGLLAQSSGRIDCSNVLQYAVNAFYADGGTIWVHNSGASYSTNAFYANNDGTIYGTAVTSDTSTNALRTGSTGTNRISGVSFEVRDSVTYSVYQETSSGRISIGSARLNIEKFSVVNWSVVDISFDTTIDDDERFKITEEMDVGVAEYGSKSSLGEGPPYTRGMTVITTDSTATSTTDGGNLTDVSAAARSPSGSTFTFQGTAANHTILIGSSLSDGSDVLKHWGIVVRQTTAAVEVTPKSFVFELWNGTTWVTVRIMDVHNVYQYRYANEIFIRANQSEIIRYGADDDTTWAKKTISGNNLYWARIRITTAVTTLPVFEQFKLVPSFAELNSDGTYTANGLGRWRVTLQSFGNIYGESGGVIDNTINVGSGGTPTGWAHNIKNSQMNSNGDAIYFQFALPRGICTSCPVYLNAVLVPNVGGAGTVTMIASFLPAEVAGVLVADPSGGVTPIPRTLANTDAVTAVAGQTNTQTFTSGTTNKLQVVRFGPFYVDNCYEADNVYVRVEMSDDGAGNADVLIHEVEVLSAMWTLGRRLLL